MTARGFGFVIRCNMQNLYMIRTGAFKRIAAAAAGALFGLGAALGAEVTAQNAAEIQAALDRGDDVALVKGKVYEVNTPIRYQRNNQKIYTKGARRISDNAVLRVTSPEGGQVINGNGKSGILLERVTLDGNRYNLPPYPDGGPELAWFGGNGAKNQTIRNCVFMNSRTWSTFKLHEGGKDCKIENSVFFGCGADARGNGRFRDEKPFKWGDGISCAAERSTVSNNLIIDPTDVGVVIFCAPGTVVKDNVIASISRESLGGINLVDGLGFYEMDKGRADPADKDAMRRYDYRGVEVKNNLIDSRGARIHIAVPMGATVWVPRDKRVMTFVGAKILDNTLAGGASAYGFVADGVDGFEVRGNKSVGKHSGLADGRWDVLCDEPGPFLFNPEYVENSKLQPEFKPQKRSLQHLLRCNHGPLQQGGSPFRGYRAYSYGPEEARAVVQTAYIEMLGREPTAEELDRDARIINEHVIPADQFRWMLMDTPEFKSKNPGIGRNQLHDFRTGKWLKAIDAAAGSSDWKAKDVYEAAFKSMLSK